MPSFSCPVCGFAGLPEPARFAEGGSSHGICPSCGFEFGYDDEDQGWTDEAWRAEWVAEGMPWRVPEWPKPEGWDPQAQLDRLLSGGTS